ncbi:MAG: hypothetical protein PHI12_08725 [Dehalococcoidales bacterium]|nr:hypothetical protein [Dehalococcoidales bacterium]
MVKKSAFYYSRQPLKEDDFKKSGLVEFDIDWYFIRFIREWKPGLLFSKHLKEKFNGK